MNSNFRAISNRKHNSARRVEVDSTSDKENKKYDINIQRNYTKPKFDYIDGIKSLGSDEFINNFEDFRSLVKDTPLPKTMQARQSVKIEESKNNKLLTKIPSDMTPLNNIICHMNRKSTF